MSAPTVILIDELHARQTATRGHVCERDQVNICNYCAKIMPPGYTWEDDCVLCLDCYYRFRPWWHRFLCLSP